MVLRWGIASCSRASHDFAQALKTFPTEEHILFAVGSSNQETSDTFRNLYHVERGYPCYESLAKDRDVDVIYVSVHNGLHYEICKLMLDNSKHVVCEKPLSYDKRTAKELTLLAKMKRVFLIEAMWTKFFPAWKFLDTIIEENIIGELMFVQVTFGLSMYNRRNLDLKSMYKGSIMDFGLYGLTFQQNLFKDQIPMKVITTGHLGLQSVDESASCIIHYPEGKTVDISVHTKVDLPNEAIIVGTEGTIRIPHFWFPTKVILPNGREEIFKLPGGEKTVSRTVAFIYLIDEVQKCIKKGLLESEVHDHNCTLQIIAWMEMWRKQLEVKYDLDI